VGSDGTAWIAGLDEDGEREWLVLDIPYVVRYEVVR